MGRHRTRAEIEQARRERVQRQARADARRELRTPERIVAMYESIGSYKQVAILLQMDATAVKGILEAQGVIFQAPNGSRPIIGGGNWG